MLGSWMGDGEFGMFRLSTKYTKPSLNTDYYT